VGISGTLSFCSVCGVLVPKLRFGAKANVFLDRDPECFPWLILDSGRRRAVPITCRFTGRGPDSPATTEWSRPMAPRGASPATADHVIGIFSPDSLNTALAAVHRSGYGPQTRVIDGARGDVGGQ